MDLNLHPYDGVERCFRHTDRDRTTGFEVIARVLHLPVPSAYNVIFYDLSFYSGGVGIIDRLAISLPANRTIWESVITSFRAETLEEANNSDWAPELFWLLSSGEDEEDETTVIVCEAAVE